MGLLLFEDVFAVEEMAEAVLGRRFVLMTGQNGR